MKNQLPEVQFNNQESPNSFFDIVRIEEFLHRDLDHNIEVNHLVKFYIIIVILEGQGYHTIDFTDYNYKKGTVLLVRRDQVHKFFKSPNVKGYLLAFTEEFIIGHLNRMEALKTMQLFNESLGFPKIEFKLKEEFTNFSVLVKHLELEYSTQDTFSAGITRSLLHIVITKLFRTKAEAGHFVEDKKYILQFLAFQKLVEKECFKSRKVQYYANKLAVSTKTLNIIVKDVIKISAKSFIDERATMQIKRLLLTTDYSIKEIIYIAGFNDPNHFFKYFKKFTDTSPKAFRQAN